jgi:rubrerythrin
MNPINPGETRRQEEEAVSKNLDLEKVWRLAIQNEQEAREVYEDMANMVEDTALKNLFMFLVEQEKRHKQLLEEEFDKYFLPEY